MRIFRLFFLGVLGAVWWIICSLWGDLLIDWLKSVLPIQIVHPKFDDIIIFGPLGLILLIYGFLCYDLIYKPAAKEIGGPENDKGSKINIGTMSGGQVAHQITNNFAPPERTLTTHQLDKFIESASSDVTLRAITRVNANTPEARNFAEQIIAMINSAVGWNAGDMGTMHGTLPPFKGIKLYYNLNSDGANVAAEKLKAGFEAAGIPFDLRNAVPGISPGELGVTVVIDIGDAEAT